MPTPSPEIIRLLSVFAVAMTAPTFAKSLVLIYGTILTPGLRTVSAVLRVMGLADLETFGNRRNIRNGSGCCITSMSRSLRWNITSRYSATLLKPSRLRGSG